MVELSTNLIASGGLVGVFLLMVLENLFPPIPSELIMPLAGFAAARGQMSILGVSSPASLGSLAGNAVWFELARAFGAARMRRLVERYGRWSGGAREIVKAEAALRRNGPVALFFGRFMPGVRTAISVPAGPDRDAAAASSTSGPRSARRSGSASWRSAATSWKTNSTRSRTGPGRSASPSSARHWWPSAGISGARAALPPRRRARPDGPAIRALVSGLRHAHPRRSRAAGLRRDGPARRRQPVRASRPPPSTRRATPVMKPASSLARNSAAFATSQAVPIRRRSGTLPSRAAATSARGRPVARARVSTAIGVSISPGRMVLQRMPCSAFWNATCSVKAIIAALVAL